MKRVFWHLAAALAVACVHCGGDSEPASDGGTARDGAAQDGEMRRDVRQLPAGEWKRAWSEEPGRASCGMGEGAFEGLEHLTFDGATIYVGYEQASGDNQNPIVARFDEGEQTWCVSHETEAPDGRALGLTWNGGEHAYVVYTVVGGGTGLEGQGGWLSSYAPGAIHGGGPKVSYVGRIDVQSGQLSSGTFIIAVLSSGGVNTHRPTGAVSVLDDGAVEFYGSSAHKPIDADKQSSMDCTDYPFDSRYRFSADLMTLRCADCSNCIAQRPCE